MRTLANFAPQRHARSAREWKAEQAAARYSHVVASEDAKMAVAGEGALGEQRKEEKVAREPIPEVSFAEFLEGVPPAQIRRISDLVQQYTANSAYWELLTPQLLLHCTNDMCNGPRAHRRNSDDVRFLKGDSRNTFVTYICSNCRQRTKLFSLRVWTEEGAEGPSGIAYKFGEMPPFGPITPTRLLKLLGDQREFFLKGRRCENQGLGIGAFGYYRRVVEHQKNRIIDEIIKVSRKLGAEKEMLAELEEAKAEVQFSKSVALIKHGIPQALLINGHNPLTLLHNALSAGLHEQSDEACLELAQAVRVVLADLAERLSQALKDEAELNSAVTRLLNAKSSTPVQG
jgi:hypothetical protein